jgi:hypothetical protein
MNLTEPPDDERDRPADGEPEPTDAPDEPRLSFKDREMVIALRRLANARSQLSHLEEQMAANASARVVDPAELARLEAYQADIDKLTVKAGGRFGGGAARARLSEVEMQLRLALERLGVASIDELRTKGSSPSEVTVDEGVLDFARRELAAAEQGYREVLALPDEPDRPDDLDASS